MADIVAPVGPGGLRPPPPSLIGQLLPMMRESESAMTTAIQRLDNVSTWDTARINHEGLLQALDELHAQRAEWQTSMLNALQSLWVREAKSYADYRTKIERTLVTRHLAELGNAFPRMRKSATASSGGSDAAGSDASSVARGAGQQQQRRFSSSAATGAHDATPMSIGGGLGPTTPSGPDGHQHADLQDDAAVLNSLRSNDEQAKLRKHANKLGFNFDATNARLVMLLQRQLKEESVLIYVTGVHVELLATAKRDDTQRLKAMLQQLGVHFDGLVQKVERKIQSSVKVSADTAGNIAGILAATVSASTVTGGGSGSQQQQPLRPQPPSALRA